MAKATASEKVPKAMQATFARIVSITDDFARRYLNEEYAQLARYATAALCRKRPSPLAKGQAKTWACGITHALGMVNFLFDSSQDPHMKASALYQEFGVSQSSGQAKSKAVRDLLDMGQFDPNWCLPSKMADNPLIWMVMVNGFVVDIRQMPLEVQQQAYEKGIIPYIPGGEAASALAPQGRSRGKSSTRGQQACGLCGKTGPLTKTPCCGNWICDDEHEYRLFSYARNSCSRNHDRYTLCAYHFYEEHQGDWQECEACRNAFETEIYVDYGTNEYNFTVLDNPPTYEPTTCDSCGEVIVLSDGGYSVGADGYMCGTCTAKKYDDLLC